MTRKEQQAVAWAVSLVPPLLLGSLCASPVALFGVVLIWAVFGRALAGLVMLAFALDNQGKK